MAYVMFVNNTPLFITMSRSINFMTVKHMPKNMAKKLGKSLKWVVKIYSINSMILQTVLINVHFYNTIDYLTENFIVNNYTAKGHVDQIE